MRQTLEETIRKVSETCSSLGGFLIFHSVGGGTGSGLCSLILHELSVAFAKKPKLGFTVYPSPTISISTLEPYNAIFATQ